MSNAQLAIALAGFVLNVLVIAIGGTWKLSRVELALREALTSHREAVDEEISAVRQSQAETADLVRREMGEGLAALRTKVHEIETWSRDHFVRRDSFQSIIADAMQAMKERDEQTNVRLSRFEEKLDRLIERR